MNIIKRIASGNIEAAKEVYDWADKEVLSQIKGKFSKENFPKVTDGLPNAEILINEKSMPVSQEQITKLTKENNMMLKQIIRNIKC